MWSWSIARRRTRGSSEMRIQHLLLSLTLFITCAVSRLQALRILMLDVPSPANVGDSVEMTCSYELEGDRLYSVKWYKNDVEFYRYVPKDWPPGQFLSMHGIRVDLSRSNKRSVFLKHVDLFSEGIYRCEVSAEAPSFNTAEMEKEMKVHVLPTDGPKIYGNRPMNKVGDVVSVNCTSSKSKPVQVLKWYINDNLVDSSKNTGEYETIFSTQPDHQGLEVSSLTLKFIVSKRHFNHGNMRLKCTASIGRSYVMRSEVITAAEPDEEEMSRLQSRAIENLDQMKNSAHSSTWSGYWSLSSLLSPSPSSFSLTTLLLLILHTVMLLTLI